jgi:hypothetical protein
MKGPWFWFWRKNFQATDRRLESADPRSQLFFGPQDIFPRLRFGKDVHTPGTPAFDSVSPSAGLFLELIPALDKNKKSFTISFFIGSAWGFDRKASLLKGASTRTFTGTPIDTPVEPSSLECKAEIEKCYACIPRE